MWLSVWWRVLRCHIRLKICALACVWPEVCPLSPSLQGEINGLLIKAEVEGADVLTSNSHLHPSVAHLLLWSLFCILCPFADKIDDDLEMTMVCHRPEGLEQLEAQTNFSKRELQVLYRGFKNVSSRQALVFAHYQIKLWFCCMKISDVKWTQIE